MTKTSANPVQKRPQEATALLCSDHALVAKLFAAFEASSSAKKNKEIVAHICTEHSVRAQVGKENFYPTIKNGDA